MGENIDCYYYDNDSDVIMFLCDSNVDNVPITKGFISETGEEIAFSISQSRSSGKKKGQDAIAVSSRGNYECCVICDGHDIHGDIVARTVSKTLSSIVLDRLLELPATCDLSSQEAEIAIVEAFEECERLTMWTDETIKSNSFVKVISGEFEGMVGYVSEVHAEDSCYSVIVIDARNFHKPRLQRKQLECAKYTGGCTCVAYIRDASKNIARIATMGDTRVLLVNGKKSGLEKDSIFEEILPGAFLSYPHDVFNTAELHRIQTNIDPKDYEIDGPYLINPFTGCEIQPTRGFGDFDMYGCGFINIPDISLTFTLPKGSLLLVASDGIFDDQVWDFRDLIKYIEQKIDPKNYKDLETFAAELHKETINKSLAGGYVDDISLFACYIDPPKPKVTAGTSSTRASVAGTIITTNKTQLDSSESRSSSITSHSRKGSAIPTLSRSIAFSQDGRKKSSTSKLGRSYTHDAVSLARMTTFSASYREVREIRAQTAVSTKSRYLVDQKNELNKSIPRKSIVETIRRTYGPSFMLPDGVISSSTSSKLGDEAAKIVAQNAVKDLPSFSFDASANASSTSKAASSTNKKKSTIIEVNAAGPYHANAVLQRIAMRFGHDLAALEQLVKDIEIV